MATEGERIAELLTDDRNDPDLLVFERTWGHRLLAGVSVAMLVVALVLCAYCVYMLVALANAGVENLIATFGFTLYTAGIVGAALLVPPGVFGIYVAKHPAHAALAIGLAAFALVALVALAVYALGVPGVQLFSTLLYLGVASVFPIVYLVAAVKVKRHA